MGIDANMKIGVIAHLTFSVIFGDITRKNVLSFSPEVLLCVNQIIL